MQERKENGTYYSRDYGLKFRDSGLGSRGQVLGLGV